LTIRALVMGDGVPCYGALEIVGLLLLLLLLLLHTDRHTDKSSFMYKMTMSLSNV